MNLDRPHDMDLDDFEQIKRIFSAAGATLPDIEDFIGPLSLEQKYALVGVMVGFHFANLDHLSPRADGKKWKKIFEDILPK